MPEPGLEGRLERLGVHVGEHEHPAGVGVLDDARQERAVGDAQRRIGRPHAATSCFTSATVASPSWKIDAASAACAPAASAAAMSAGPPAPPEAIDRHAAPRP